MRGRWQELALIATFSLIAAARVFTFSAAFPFFNNVDEHAHVDVVRKYARGYWPRQAIETYDHDSGRLFALFGTYEYMVPLDRFPGGVAPPPPADAPRQAVDAWARVPNFEAHAPPVYYAVAGGWYRLCGWAGLESGAQLYFLKFMNVPAIVLMVWLAYWFCIYGFPDRQELRMCVPMLIAFLPQDLFYSVNSDVLSAPLFTLSLILSLMWHARAGGAKLGALAGVLVALTFLVKQTNIALPAIFGLIVVMKLSRAVRAGAWREAIRSVLPAVTGAAFPIALWSGRNYHLFGDWLGTTAKIEHLGWSARPLTSFLSHPIFTPAGLWVFWDGLMATFWRGEFVWHLKPMAHAQLDRFYSLSSAILLCVSGAFLLLGRRAAGSTSSRSLVTATVWLSVLLSLACLALLSVTFEFGNSYYPSREHPFFTSGRLISGMLIPFLVLYVDGIACLMRPFARVSGTIAVIVAICLIMLISEIALTMPLFGNPYNWFHLG